MKRSTLKGVGGVLLVLVFIFLTVLAGTKSKEAKMSKEFAEKTQEMDEAQMEACKAEQEQIASRLEELIVKVDSLSSL
ncbi:MAG: hypothetical protein AAF363_05825 [Bacteroidota bacterium]